MRLRSSALIGTTGIAVALLGWTFSALDSTPPWFAVVLVVTGVLGAGGAAIHVVRELRRAALTERRHVRSRLESVDAALQILEAETERRRNQGKSIEQRQALTEDRADAYRERLHAMDVRSEGLAKRLTALSQSAEELNGRAAKTEEALGQLRHETDERGRGAPSQEELAAKVTGLMTRVEGLTVCLAEQMAVSGRDPRRLLNDDELGHMVPRLVADGRVLALVALSKYVDLQDFLEPTQMRSLVRLLRATGHWRLAERVAAAVCSASGLQQDEEAHRRLSTDLCVLERLVPPPSTSRGDRPSRDVSGPVLHLVGETTPGAQAGSTPVIPQIARAQAGLGVPSFLVVRPGGSGTDRQSDHEFEQDGLRCVELAGACRNDVGLAEWLHGYVATLDKAVCRHRPSVIHAYSVLDGAAAVTVGSAHDVPVVYETSAAPEDCRLGQVCDTLGLNVDPAAAPELVGPSGAHCLVGRADEQVRAAADAVVVPTEGLESLDVDVVARDSLRHYQAVGAQWPILQVLGAEDCLRRRGVDPDEVLHTLLKNPPPRRGWFQLGGTPDAAEEIMVRGWIRHGHPPVKLHEIADWSSFAQIDRSWAFHLHAWEFVDSFLGAREEVTAEQANYLAAVVLDWVSARDAREASEEPDDSMAYYDMALALRAPRLLLVLEVLAAHDQTCAVVPVVVELILHDRDKLREDEAFTAQTNHGFYAAAAQLHLEKYLSQLPERADVLRQARERMALLVKSQFAEDGGHLEHSPDYHRMLLGSFHAAVRDELIDDRALVDQIERAANVLGWMTQPDGAIVAMGDSPPRRLHPAHSMGDEHTLWLASDGAKGSPQDAELLTLPESGYAFIRSPQPQEPGTRAASSYLAVQAGFHSRAHKHADDLSFVWYDRGQEICVDGGRFGYGHLLPPGDPMREQGFYYADPRRQHVESTRAHNALEMDGTIQDRRRRPFGSGLVSAEKEGEAFVIVARAPYADYTHRRKLNLVPGRRLIVLDSVHSRREDEREAVAWFLLNGSLELLESAGNGVRFRLPSGDVLQVSSDGRVLAPVRGQESPLRGWRSCQEGELEPAWSFGVAFDVRTRGGAQTELRLQQP